MVFTRLDQTMKGTFLHMIISDEKNRTNFLIQLIIANDKKKKRATNRICIKNLKKWRNCSQGQLKSNNTAIRPKSRPTL